MTRHDRPSPDDDEQKELDPVEEASQESFPASDPPSWEPMHLGTPDEHKDEHPDGDTKRKK